MVDLLFQLKLHLRVNFKEPSKMRKNGTLEDAFFSAFEGIPKGLSKGTPKVVP